MKSPTLGRLRSPFLKQIFALASVITLGPGCGSDSFEDQRRTVTVEKRPSGEAGSSADGVADDRLALMWFLLPDRAQLREQYTGIDQLISGYKFRIWSKQAECPYSSEFVRSELYEDGARVVAMVAKDCDYVMEVQLGTMAGDVAPPPDTSDENPDPGDEGSGGNNSGEDENQAPPPGNDLELMTYDGGIKALVDASCISCHSSAGGQAPFLTNYAEVNAKGDRVVARIADASRPMPPAGLLPADQIAQFQQWEEDGYLEAVSNVTNDEEAGESESEVADGELSAVIYRTSGQLSSASLEGRSSFQVQLRYQLQEDGSDAGITTEWFNESGSSEE